MNITINELMLQDKKVKFGKGDVDTTVSAPVPETTTNPEAGMKALMFQGMKNLMSDPELAQEAGVANDEAKPEAKKSYAAPYSANIAFGFNKAKASAAAAKAMAGLSAVALAGLMASCRDEIRNENSTVVTVEQQSEMATIMQQVMEYLKTLVENSEKQSEQNETIILLQKASNEYMQKVYQMVMDGTVDFKNFASAVFSYMSEDKDVKDAILVELIKQGKSRDEADKFYQAKINEIIVKLNNHEITLSQAIALLGEIKDGVNNIGKVLADFYNAYVDEAQKNNEFRTTIVNQGNVSIDLLRENNKTLKEMKNDVNGFKAYADSMLVLANEKPEELMAAIKENTAAIALMDLHADMNKDEIVAAINKFKNEVLPRMDRSIELDSIRNVWLETYGPLIIGQSPDNTSVLKALEDIAKLVKENTAAVNGVATVTQEQVDKQEECNELLRKLSEKAEPFMANVNTYIGNAQKNWDKLFNYLEKAAQVDADAHTNDSIAHAQMLAQLKLGNLYLDKIEQDVAKIKTNTDSLNTISGGNGLTYDQLDQLLNKYTNKITPFIDGLEVGQKDLSDLIKEISAKIDKLDKTDDPDYTDLIKDIEIRIQVLIEKLGNNEGIIRP